LTPAGRRGSVKNCLIGLCVPKSDPSHLICRVLWVKLKKKKKLMAGRAVSGLPVDRTTGGYLRGGIENFVGYSAEVRPMAIRFDW